MFICKCMNELASSFFKDNRKMIFVPASILACIMIALYYFLLPIYMLFDLAVRKIDDLLCGNYDGVKDNVLAIRNIIGFIFIIPFYSVTVVLTMVFAIGYFLAYVFIFVGTGFKKHGKIFAFHNYFENYEETK